MFYSIRYKYQYSESVLNFFYVYDKVKQTNKQTNKVLRGKKIFLTFREQQVFRLSSIWIKRTLRQKKGYI